MGYDTKTDRLTDCQSQCDFDFQCTSFCHLSSVTQKEGGGQSRADRRGVSLRYVRYRDGIHRFSFTNVCLTLKLTTEEYKAVHISLMEG
jgi:hypothetical protein